MDPDKIFFHNEDKIKLIIKNCVFLKELLNGRQKVPKNLAYLTLENKVFHKWKFCDLCNLGFIAKSFYQGLLTR